MTTYNIEKMNRNEITNALIIDFNLEDKKVKRMAHNARAKRLAKLIAEMPVEVAEVVETPKAAKKSSEHVFVLVINDNDDLKMLKYGYNKRQALGGKLPLLTPEELNDAKCGRFHTYRKETTAKKHIEYLNAIGFSNLRCMELNEFVNAA